MASEQPKMSDDGGQAEAGTVDTGALLMRLASSSLLDLSDEIRTRLEEGVRGGNKKIIQGLAALFEKYERIRDDVEVILRDKFPRLAQLAEHTAVQAQRVIAEEQAKAGESVDRLLN